MVYNSGQTGIDDVRNASGNLIPTDTTDAQITDNLNSAFSTIQLAVGRTLTNPFGVTDVEYPYSKTLEKKIAAMETLKPYMADTNIRAKVEELDDETTRGLQFLKENLQEDTGDTQLLLAQTSYLSYGAAIDENPDQTTVSTYRSGLIDSV